MSRALLSLAACLTAFACASAQAGCLPPPGGLIAWYPGERHADDAAGFHHGTLLDGTAYTDGFKGEAFRFDGIGNGVFTDTTGAEQRKVRESFSYSMWVKPTGVMPQCGEATSGNCSNIPWVVFPTHGDNSGPNEPGVAAGIGVGVGTNGICVGQHAAFLVSCLAFASISLADWTHVVAVVENKTPRIYVDGVLLRSGIASTRDFVFASWEVFGSGLSLGRYSGDLDELAVFDRALSEMEIGELFLAGRQGLCTTQCTQHADDAFQGATITSTTGLRSSHPGGIFGAVDVSPEVDSLLLADGQADGTVHAIEWETRTPVLMDAFGLHAMHDAFDDTQRAFRHVRMQARLSGQPFATVYERDVVLPYAPGDRQLSHCAKLRPALYQEFRVEFTQDGPAGFSGPRVLELDGIATPVRVFHDGFEEG